MKERIQFLLSKNKLPKISELFDEETLQEKREKRFRKHTRILFLFFCCAFTVIAGKLFYIQILKHEYYAEKAEHQHEHSVQLHALRGNVFDRNGKLLVTSAYHPSYVADSKWVPDSVRKYIAGELSSIFGVPPGEYLKKFRSYPRYVVLERTVSPILATRVREKSLPLITELPFPHRMYPSEKLGAQLLGFTNGDNVGISGVELALDSLLKGKDGEILLQKVGANKMAARLEYPHIKPVQGSTVYLTLDGTIQSIVEDILQGAVERCKAIGGIAIIIHPQTGEILAMAQYPFLYPSKVNESETKDQKLRAITDMFEPGSVFKLVTMAAALEYNLVQPDNVFTAGSKYFAPYRRAPIVDTHSSPMLSMREAFEQSSNIVAAKISDRVGANYFYQTAKNFGFGEATGIDLAGEVAGVVKKPFLWSKTSLNTMAFGYEVSVTPLQVLMAYAAIANHGVLLTPYLVKKILSPDHRVLYEGRSSNIRRVVSEKTAATLSSFMEGVVLRGTAKESQVEGIRIAGKTGTTKKNINGHYVVGRYQSMFVGFFPVEKPEFAALIMIDDPSGVYYASQTAAPAFKELVEKISATTGIPKKNVASFEKSMPIAGNDSDVLQKKIARRNYSLVKDASQKNDTMISTALSLSLLPNVVGMSTRKAFILLSELKISPQIFGTGIIVKQFPSAGEKIKENMSVKLYCASEKIAINN